MPKLGLSKINKQRYGLAGKGLGNAVNINLNFSCWNVISIFIDYLNPIPDAAERRLKTLFYIWWLLLII